MQIIGTAGALGVGNGGDHVRDAGAGGDEADSGLARYSRVAVRGVARGLLVTGVHHADAFVQTAVVDGLDVAAAERENVVDALSLECLRHQAPAVNLCHGGAL